MLPLHQQFARMLTFYNLWFEPLQTKPGVQLSQRCDLHRKKESLYYVCRKFSRQFNKNVKLCGQKIICKLFKIVISKFFFYPDEILEINDDKYMYNNLKSDGLLAGFPPCLFRLPHNKLSSANYFRNKISSFQICTIGLGKITLQFQHFRCSTLELPKCVTCMCSS